MANKINMAREVRQFPNHHPDYTIERAGGDSVILKHKGVELGPYSTPARAKIAVGAHRRRLNKVPRHCMCCRTAFMADGRFNRLCKWCKGISTYD